MTSSSAQFKSPSPKQCFFGGKASGKGAVSLILEANVYFKVVSEKSPETTFQDKYICRSAEPVSVKIRHPEESRFFKTFANQVLQCQVFPIWELLYILNFQILDRSVFPVFEKMKKTLCSFNHKGFLITKVHSHPKGLVQHNLYL